MGEVMRTALGPKLAAYYDADLAPPPLVLVELLARFCVTEAMAAFDRNRHGQPSPGPDIGDS